MPIFLANEESANDDFVKCRFCDTFYHQNQIITAMGVF